MRCFHPWTCMDFSFDRIIRKLTKRLLPVYHTHPVPSYMLYKYISIQHLHYECAALYMHMLNLNYYMSCNPQGFCIQTVDGSSTYWNDIYVFTSVILAIVHVNSPYSDLQIKYVLSPSFDSNIWDTTKVITCCRSYLFFLMKLETKVLDWAMSTMHAKCIRHACIFFHVLPQLVLVSNVSGINHKVMISSTQFIDWFCGNH